MLAGSGVGAGLDGPKSNLSTAGWKISGPPSFGIGVSESVPIPLPASASENTTSSVGKLRSLIPRIVEIGSTDTGNVSVIGPVSPVGTVMLPRTEKKPPRWRFSNERPSTIPDTLPRLIAI